MTFALIYHDIAPAAEADRYGFSGPVAARYKLDPKQFEAHLAAIAAAAVTVDLADGSPAAALTFDDGGASALLAAEAIERHGWRAHFFITTGRIGTPGFLDAEEIVELARRGHDVGSHSHTHPTYMGALRDEEIAREWRQSRDVLGELLGSAPRTAALPGGFISRAVIDQASCAGYQLLMTSEPTARAVRRNGIKVQGRYTIWARTSATRAAAYARGELLARSALWLSWQAKTTPKRLSPRTYEAARQLWARQRRRQ